jgi:ferrous-iron efflux pump FieF
MFCGHNHHLISREESRRYIKIAAFSTFSITLFLVVCRTVAYFATGSITVEASIFDAVKDWFVSSLNAFFVMRSVKTSDDKYPFGYGKIEALLALFHSIFLLSMTSIVIVNIVKSHKHHVIEFSSVACAAFGVSIVGALILVCVQTYVGRKTHSLAIRADAAHYKSDIILDIGVLISLMLSYAAAWIDIVVGGCIAAYLFCVSISIGKTALAALLDKSLCPEVVREIRNLVENAGGKVHAIRTHSLGRGEFIAVELVEGDDSDDKSDVGQNIKVDSKKDIVEIKRIHTAIRNEIRQRFAQSFIVISTKLDS